MRRGLLKDLANTPTQIVCGWRLYGDLKRLSGMVPSVVTVDLIAGTCAADEGVVAPPLGIAVETSRWVRERFERDGIPAGTVTKATLILTPRHEPKGLAIGCVTLIETPEQTYESHDTARWHLGDFTDE